MTTTIATIAQLIGAFAFIYAGGSYFNDHNSPVALPLFCVAGICIIITVICWRIVA